MEPNEVQHLRYTSSGLSWNCWNRLYGPLDDYCVSITAFAKTGADGQHRGYTPINNIHQPAGGAARIYDTGDGDNCDVDLFTPNPKFFGGPEFGGPVSCSDCCGGASFESVMTPRIGGIEWNVYPVVEDAS